MNNPALYNAVISAAGSGTLQSRWPTTVTPSSYASLASSCIALAVEVDSLIPTIPTGATAKHVNLLSGIVQNILASRHITMQLPGDYVAIAQAIVAAYTAYHDVLVSEPTVLSQFFPLDAASTIPGYSQLVRAPTFGVEDDDSVTIAVGDGLTLIESYVTNAQDPGETLVSGMWLLNIWRYASDPGVSNLKFRMYARTPAGVETLLWEADSGIINEAAVAYEFLAIPTPSPISIGVSDRLVLKIYAITTSAAPTTIHFVHNGSVHSSYIVNVV